MADRCRLVQISSEKDDSPNRFSKGAVKEEVMGTLIHVTADAFLTTFPIFTSQIVFGWNSPLLETREKSLFLVESSSSRSSYAETVVVCQ
jgi:hypothetical protein